MLPLTLRPTDIGTPPAFQHLKDYCVFEDGEKIGRIYECTGRAVPSRHGYGQSRHEYRIPTGAPTNGTPRPSRTRGAVQDYWFKAWKRAPADRLRTDVSNSDEYRKQAEQAKRMAALKQEDKEFWLRLAEEWLKLARDADTSTKRQ